MLHGDISNRLQAYTVLDDIEWASTDALTDHYSGSTADFTAQQTTVLEGSYTLRDDAAYTGIFNTDGYTLTRGNRYAGRIQFDSPASPHLMIHKDPTTAYDADAYSCYVDQDSGSLSLRRWNSDSSATTLDSVSVSLTVGNVYDAVCETDGSGNIRASVHQTDGNDVGSVIAQTSWVADTTYSGGTFGFYTSSGTSAYYDWVREY